MARLDAKWYNFWGDGQTWYHFWQDTNSASVSNISGSITGTSTVTGVLKGSGSLSGSISGTSTVSGTLNGSGALAGAISGTSTVTGSLNGVGSLVGTVNGLSDVLGTLIGVGYISVTISGEATVTGTLINAGSTIDISGTANGTSSVTGILINATPEPPPTPVSPADGQFVGGGKRKTYQGYTWEQQEEDKRRTKIIHEDKVIVEIIKIWATQCQ